MVTPGVGQVALGASSAAHVEPVLGAVRAHGERLQGGLTAAVRESLLRLTCPGTPRLHNARSAQETCAFRVD